jgi:hypothetical protein
LRWPRDTLYPLKLALTSLTGGDRSIGIVRYRTKNHGVLVMYFTTHSITHITWRQTIRRLMNWKGFRRK